MAEWKDNKPIEKIHDKVSDMQNAIDDLVRDGYLDKTLDEKTNDFLYTTTKDPMKLKKAKELFGI